MMSLPSLDWWKGNTGLYMPAGISSPLEFGTMYGWWESAGSDPGTPTGGTTGIVPQTVGSNNCTDWLDSSVSGNDLNALWTSTNRDCDIGDVGGFKYAEAVTAAWESRGIYDNTAALRDQTTGTVYAFCKLVTDAAVADQGVLGFTSDFANRNLSLGIDASRYLSAKLERRSGVSADNCKWNTVDATGRLTVGTWYLLTWVQDGVALTGYVDGNEIDFDFTEDGGGAPLDGDWIDKVGSGVGNQRVTTYATLCNSDGGATNTLENVANGGFYQLLEHGIWDGTVLSGSQVSQLSAYLHAKYGV